MAMVNAVGEAERRVPLVEPHVKTGYGKRTVPFGGCAPLRLCSRLKIDIKKQVVLNHLYSFIVQDGLFFYLLFFDIMI